MVTREESSSLNENPLPYNVVANKLVGIEDWEAQLIT